jgi:hypothetical protein
MKRTAVITQPTYLPWLGYFEQMRRADVFVFLDSVQFERRSWQCRNRILNARGEPEWLTVPLKHQPRETAIRDILVTTDRADWAQDHLCLLETRLGSTPHFGEVREVLEPVLLARRPHLADMNIALIRALAARLGLAPEFLRSSELPVTGARADLIVNLAQHVGATDYYSAAGSAAYLDEACGQFAAAKIAYCYQTWEHPRYAQGRAAFVSHLSAVDALCWIGFDAVAGLLHAGSAPQLQAV